jgi:hypothetical protein
VHLFPSSSSLLPISPRISVGLGRCIKGALVIRYQKSNDSILGLALGRCDRLRVRVQRQPRRGMPKQILLNLISVPRDRRIPEYEPNSGLCRIDILQRSGNSVNPAHTPSCYSAPCGIVRPGSHQQPWKPRAIAGRSRFKLASTLFTGT